MKKGLNIFVKSGEKVSLPFRNFAIYSARML